LQNANSDLEAEIQTKRDEHKKVTREAGYTSRYLERLNSRVQDAKKKLQMLNDELQVARVTATELRKMSGNPVFDEPYGSALSFMNVEQSMIITRIIAKSAVKAITTESGRMIVQDILNNNNTSTEVRPDIPEKMARITLEIFNESTSQYLTEVIREAKEQAAKEWREDSHQFDLK
jgi:hypothetical protein